jgi:3-hydroxyisobutyrate dehydrogenase-like beta-hydroxyacid dehydrogenase
VGVSTSEVGLIGVGLLGTALAERMIAHGVRVAGFDSNSHRLQLLNDLGGSPRNSAESVAGSCAITVLCLPDSSVVAAVAAEIRGAIGPGTLLIDATTGDPDDTLALAERLRKPGVGYVDATIAGSSEQVRRGEAVVLIGGETADVERAESVLATWSDRRFYLGPSSAGARMKLVVNLVLGLNRAVLAEGLALAEAAGIPASAALTVLQATPAYSRIMDSKGPKMAARDFAPEARLAQHLKDVRLIQALARRHAANTPLSDIHEQLLAEAVAMGLGDADNSAVFGVYSARAARSSNAAGASSIGKSPPPA